MQFSKYGLSDKVKFNKSREPQKPRISLSTPPIGSLISKVDIGGIRSNAITKPIINKAFQASLLLNTSSYSSLYIESITPKTKKGK